LDALNKYAEEYPGAYGCRSAVGDRPRRVTMGFRARDTESARSLWCFALLGRIIPLGGSETR